MVLGVYLLARFLLLLRRARSERWRTLYAALAVPVLEHFRHVSGVGVALRLLREALVARQVTREVLEAVRTELYALWRDPAMDLGAVAGPVAAPRP